MTVIAVARFFDPSFAQAQSPEPGGAVVAIYMAVPGLVYDRCAKLGFSEILQPTAEERFEIVLKNIENSKSTDPRIPAAEYKAVINGTRAGWEKLKNLIAQEPDSNFTSQKCADNKKEFDKNRKWFPVPK